MKFEDLKNYPGIFTKVSTFDVDGEERYKVQDGIIAYLYSDRQSPIDIIVRYEDSDDTIMLILRNDDEVYLDLDESFDIVYHQVSDLKTLDSDKYIITYEVEVDAAVGSSEAAVAIAFSERELEALAHPVLAVCSPNGSITEVDTSEWA